MCTCSNRMVVNRNRTTATCQQGQEYVSSIMIGTACALLAYTCESWQQLCQCYCHCYSLLLLPPSFSFLPSYETPEWAQRILIARNAKGREGFRTGRLLWVRHMILWYCNRETHLKFHIRKFFSIGVFHEIMHTFNILFSC